MVGTLTVAADQHPARVSFGVSPAPRAGQPVTFTYTGDADPDGTLTSWQWDLDGDGSFETTHAGGSATDDLREPGDADRPHAGGRRQRRAVRHRRAGPDDRAAAGRAPAGRRTRDTTAPRATLVKLTGLKLRFHSSERATATATLRAGGRPSRAGPPRPGTTTIRLRLTAAGRARLRPGTSSGQR